MVVSVCYVCVRMFHVSVCMLYMCVCVRMLKLL